MDSDNPFSSDPNEEKTSPEPEDPEETESSGNPADRFVTLTLFFEGTLALIGLAGGSWSGLAWSAYVRPDLRSIMIGTAGGIGLFLMHLALFFPGGERNPLYRHVYKPFRDNLLVRLPSFSFEDILFIAVMSGLGEEILFRGWIQTQLGIIVASVLFGLIHIWGKEGIGYGVYAIGMGFILGYLFQYTGSLWAPVLAHTINNFIGLYALEADFLPD